VAYLDPSPIPVYGGRFTAANAERLLWRAGFGPSPGQSKRLASLGLEGAVASLTRPTGPEQLIGAAPHNSQGKPLDPLNVWGDAHCWWFDRMVRTSQPLIERMTLIWHSWFATSLEATGAQLMLNQNQMMRSHALGNFLSLLMDVTKDPAMLLWLSGAENVKGYPNENYAREMMELFTLGADCGYDQADVTQQARALTGWTYTWAPGRQAEPQDFRFDPTMHDDGVKRIFGKRGRFNWQDSCHLCVGHDSHPAFFIDKLWGYLIPTPPPKAVKAALERAYVKGGYEVRPIVEAILRHPLFYEGPRMVTPPVVYVAGLLRATRQTITTDDWSWICEYAGQMLFDPPNVAGWDYTHWLDTSRWVGRLTAVYYAIEKLNVKYPDPKYSSTETPAQAVARALAFWGNPTLSATTHENLLAFARQVQRTITADWEQNAYRILRQNALLTMIPVTPDWQTS
jgi:uncharacterized protein (DUF1800 family)